MTQLSQVPQAMLKGRLTHAVTDLNTVDAGPHLLDDPHVFVSQGTTGLHVGAPFIHMKIRPTDVGAGNPNQRISGLLDSRIGHLGDLDVVGAVIDECSHWASPSCARSRLPRAKADSGSDSLAVHRSPATISPGGSVTARAPLLNALSREPRHKTHDATRLLICQEER